MENRIFVRLDMVLVVMLASALMISLCKFEKRLIDKMRGKEGAL
jgi:hypothetical protein